MSIIIKAPSSWNEGLFGRCMWAWESFDFWLLFLFFMQELGNTHDIFVLATLLSSLLAQHAVLVVPPGRQSKTAQTDKLQNYCLLGQFSILALVQFTIATVVLLQLFNNYCPLAQLRKYRPDLFCKCLNNQRLLMLALLTACKQPDLVEKDHNS